MSEAGAEDALKQLQLLAENKACANCTAQSAAGHGAVVMKANGAPLGIFVCHTCKSAHQSFSHYCKSVSQSYWKHDEVALIRAGGNERARATWMARCAPGGQLTPNAGAAAAKDFVQRCYNEKAFHGGGGGGGGGSASGGGGGSARPLSTKAVQMAQRDREAVFALPGNAVCADCSTKAPQWASVTFGSLLCLECSGAHRGLGVHISFVRSITMDSWSEKQARVTRSLRRRLPLSLIHDDASSPPPSRRQVAMMMASGNDKLRGWCAQHSIDRLPIPQKYHAPAATLYKDRLLARVEGRPEPTEMPAATTPPPASVYDGGGGGSMSAGGFGGGGGGGGGSEDHQRRLQEEARARMRAKFGAGGLGGVGSDPSYDARAAAACVFARARARARSRGRSGALAPHPLTRNFSPLFLSQGTTRARRAARRSRRSRAACAISARASPASPASSASARAAGRRRRRSRTGSPRAGARP